MTKVERVLSAADEASDFERIWGTQPTAGQQRRQSQILADAREQGLVPLGQSVSATAADQFMSMYVNSTADVFTLVGHNRGGTFVFPDGSIIDLATVGAANGPPLAVVSCDSALYVDGRALGVPTPVTMEVALDVERRFVQKVQSQESPPTLTQTQELLNASYSEAVQARSDRKFVAITLTGSGTLTASGLGIREVLTE